MDALLAMLWLAAWVPLVALVHELGHAAVAEPAGYRLSSFGVGRGPPVLRVQSPGGRVFWVGRWFLAGGACVAVPRLPLVPTRAVLFHLGGVLAQGLLALVLWALPAAWWVDTVLSFNLLVAAWNLVPWRVGRMASDGWWVLRRLWPTPGGPSWLVAQRPAVAGLAAFEARLAAPIGTAAAGLTLAWIDLLVGAPGTADLRERARVGGAELVLLATILEADRRRRRGGALAALGLLRPGPTAEGPRCCGVDTATLPAEEALALADLARVVEGRARLALGDLDGARRAVCQLAGVAGPLGAEARVLALELALAADDKDAIAGPAARLAGELERPGRWGGVDPVAAALALAAAGAATGTPAWSERAAALGARVVAVAAEADRQRVAAALGPVLSPPASPAAPASASGG